jgi:hypothetical protein
LVGQALERFTAELGDVAVSIRWGAGASSGLPETPGLELQQVDSAAAEMSRAQRILQGRLVDDASTRSFDEQGFWAHHASLLGAAGCRGSAGS